MDESSTPYLRKLCAFAHRLGWKITATTNGHHNVGSLHCEGRAIDVSVHGKTTEEVHSFIREASLEGFRVIDERFRLRGEKVWSGPHLHIEDREGM